MAPPAGHEWEVIWSSDDPKYGGDGSMPFDPADLRIAPHALTVLAPRPAS
jgi:maltooligosyltrehalose trehalohydrolase